MLSESARGHDYDSEEHDDDDDSRIVAVEAAVEPALSSTDFSSDDLQLAMQPSTPGSSLGQQILLTIQLLQSRMANLERLLLPTVPTNTSQSSILSYPSTRSVGDAVDEIFREKAGKPQVGSELYYTPFTFYTSSAFSCSALCANLFSPCSLWRIRGTAAATYLTILTGLRVQVRFRKLFATAP